jgi:hypothetical protein
MSAEVAPVHLPWMPDGEIVANFAIGAMRESILHWMTVEGGIHCETTLAVTGALAGMAAQNAVFEAYLKPQKPMPENGLLVANTTSGERFYMGDLLNQYIVPQSGWNHPIWMFVAGAVVHAGLPAEQLPDLGSLFTQVSQTIGSDNLYRLDVPDEHQPHLSAKQAIELFWLPTEMILDYKNGPGPAAGKSVVPEHWPIVLALVAQQLIGKVVGILDLAIAAKIVMHSAIIGSKLDRSGMQMRVPSSPPM